MSGIDPILRVHHAQADADARRYSEQHPSVLTVWANDTDAGSYYNGTPCGIPYHEHQWVQGLFDGVKIWHKPPDLLTAWTGEPNNSPSVLYIRVPHNQPEES